MPHVVDLDRMREFIGSLAYDPLFVTVSGAHIYGFPSPDSDVDLRGCHQLPLAEIVGLKMPDETLDRTTDVDGLEVDIVSHDVGKYFRMLTKNNGYVLEQIFSPIVVQGESFLQQLRPLAKECITRFHYHHYRGFYASRRKSLEQDSEKKAKTLLYAYRALLTGIHLLRTGEIETDILRLWSEEGLDFIPDLVASKTEEKIRLPSLDWAFHRKKLDELERRLEEAFTNTCLPETRDVGPLDEFLRSIRLR